MGNEKYLQVYDFTNENVACLKRLYNMENSDVLSVVGSGDQYFSCILNGAKNVELFDRNPTTELYLLLKFYTIRELSYEEFFDFIIKKNFSNQNIYNKLENQLPLNVIKYLKFLIEKKQQRKLKKECFRDDSIKLLSFVNKKYYFNEALPIIPYLLKNGYYKLQEKLRRIEPPKVYHSDLLDIKAKTNKKYDIMLLSNIYDFLGFEIAEYTDFLESFDIPEIQACYDWFGSHYDSFYSMGYKINKVITSSPFDYGEKINYVYSLKK